METLDLAVRNLFQEFQEVALRRAALQQALRREGTLTRKKVKGREYWYRQHYIREQAVQEYLGPSTSEMRGKINALKERLKGNKEQIRQLVTQERRRIPLFRRAGLPVLDPLTASLLERLSELNLVYQRGTLVGSHAFAAYAGILGRLFESESLKTLDIDLVRDPLLIAKEAPPIELVHPKGFIAVRGKYFHSVPGLSRKSLPSSFVGPGGLRIDILAPLRGKPRGTIRLSDLPEVGAQPLHFLDYLIEGPVPAVLLAPRGGIAVTVPDPCRYAIHKLIVATRRPIFETAKRHKDLLQASQLISACLEERPDELRSAFREAVRRGKGWHRAIDSSLRLIPSKIIQGLTLQAK